MRLYCRFFGALCLSFVAVSFGRALDIPVWRDWNPGDLADIGAATFVAVWLLSHPSPKAQPHDQ